MGLMHAIWLHFAAALKLQSRSWKIIILARGTPFFCLSTKGNKSFLEASRGVSRIKHFLTSGPFGENKHIFDKHFFSRFFRGDLNPSRLILILTITWCPPVSGPKSVVKLGVNYESRRSFGGGSSSNISSCKLSISLLMETWIFLPKIDS